MVNAKDYIGRPPVSSITTYIEQEQLKFSRLHDPPTCCVRHLVWFSVFSRGAVLFLSWVLTPLPIRARKTPTFGPRCIFEVCICVRLDDCSVQWRRNLRISHNSNSNDNNKINGCLSICQKHAQDKIEFVQSWCRGDSDNKNQKVQGMSATLDYSEV